MQSHIHSVGRLTRVGVEGREIALDSGGRVECLSLLVGEIKAEACQERKQKEKKEEVSVVRNENCLA